MHYRFRWIYCFRQEEFVKIYFFLPTTAHRNYLQKMHFVFSQTYESNLPFCFAFRGSTGAGDRFAWTLELRHHDAKIRAEIPLLTEQDER